MPPVPPTTLNVAMTAVDATQVGETGVITSAMFGGAIPLKKSLMEAVDAATCGQTHAALDATVMATEWYVLQVTWSGEQVGELLFYRTLRHCMVRGAEAFRWAGPGPLTLRDAAAFTWSKVEIAAVGQFANRFLYGNTFRYNGICATCKGELPVWRVKNGEWCESCWRSYYYTVTPVNLTQKSMGIGA